MKNKLSIVLFLLVSCLTNAQNYYFRHYQVENGLSNNSVLTSLQDKKGFMWFGTKDGLNRFDGYAFKSFQNDPNDPKTLGSNFIQCLHQLNNTIWVGTDNGLFKYDQNDESFELVETTINKSIQAIEDDNQNNMWYIANGTLYKYAVKTKENFTYEPQKNFNAITLTKDPQGSIWFATYNNLFKYDKKNNSFVKFEITAPFTNGLPFIINILKSYNKDEILIGTQNHGALVFNAKDGSIKRLFVYSEKSLYIRNFIKNGKDELWMSSENGVHIYNLKTKSYSVLRKSYNNPYSLSDNAVHSLTIDKEGGIWIGTYFGGVNYFPKQYTSFKKYFHVVGENSISGNVIREIHKDDYNNLWIGTEDGGLNKLSPNTENFQNFKADGSSQSISYNNIHAILPIKDKLWIGTFEHGLDVMDIKYSRVIKHYSTGQNGGLKSNFIYKLYQTKSGDLLALSALGIQKFDIQKDLFVAYSPYPEGYFFTSFLEDKSGNLWAGTYRDGLFCYNPKTKQKVFYKNDRKNNNSLSSNAINYIFQDSKSNIWIATENGLNLFDVKTNAFKRFTKKDFLPSNLIFTILEDSKNNLWISTSKGLVEFDVKTNKLTVYTKANGLLNDQFNYSSGFKSNNGTMYFGSVYGLISFNPDTFQKDKSKTPILITGLKINNVEVDVNKNDSPLSQSITLTDKLELKNNQSSFSIEFGSLNYNSSDMTQYWYKMEGISDEWIPLGKKHQVFFTELPSGKYTFKVKSYNSNKLYNDEIASLEIRILPPFYASTWAYLLYFALGFALVYYALRYYHEYIQQKNDQKIKYLNNQKEKEIYNAKIEFFTNIAHEIRTPLTLIKSPLDKVLKKAKQMPEIYGDLSIMEKNTSRLLHLVSQLLDFRKTETEEVKLTFVKVNINELIQNTYIRFSQVIKDKEIAISFDLSPEIIYAYVDEEALKKIVSNVLNNAIKYCRKTIIVNLEKDDAYFRISIKSDGSRIPENLKNKIFEPFFRAPETINITGTGIGLSLSHSLAELHSGTLKLDTAEKKYNSFVLALPIHQEKHFDFYQNDEKQKRKNQEEEVFEEMTNTKTTILVVEDNVDLLDFIANDLEETYHVLRAKNAHEAYNFIENQTIQLIVSDVMMPEISGFELCRKIKTDLQSSHIPVVLLTAKDNLNSKIEGLEVGADAYISKPFSMEYLKAQIENLIENRKNLMDFYSSSPLSHLKSVAHSQIDEAFIKKLDEIINENLANTELSVEILAEKMAMSRSTFYRKIKEITNLNPNELINIARLKKAAELLSLGHHKVYEIAEIVGYNSQTTFGRNFQKQFKMTPTEYAQMNDSGNK